MLGLRFISPANYTIMLIKRHCKSATLTSLKHCLQIRQFKKKRGGSEWLLYVPLFTYAWCEFMFLQKILLLLLKYYITVWHVKLPSIFKCIQKPGYKVYIRSSFTCAKFLFKDLWSPPSNSSPVSPCLSRWPDVYVNLWNKERPLFPLSTSYKMMIRVKNSNQIGLHAKR